MGTEEWGKGVAAIGGEGCASLSAAGKVQVSGVWVTGLPGGRIRPEVPPSVFDDELAGVGGAGGEGSAVDACGQGAQTEDGRAGLIEKSACERAMMPGVMWL